MTRDIEQFVAESMTRAAEAECELALGGPSTSSNAADSPTLTLRDILAAIDSLPPPPPSTSFDLYGSEGLDGAHELNVDMIPRGMRPPGSARRRVVVVPRSQLERVAGDLRRAGADVRVEPRYGCAPQQKEAAENANESTAEQTQLNGRLL